MLSKLGVVMLLKIRDWPEYFMPYENLKTHEQLIRHLAQHGYIVYGYSYRSQSTNLGVRITMKGADAIAANTDWLMERGYKVS